MSASTKLHQLQSKISDFQNQYQDLLKERQQEIAVLLSTVDLAHLDDRILVGGLLFLKNKITAQDSIVEVWRAAGEKFLRQNKPKSLIRSQPRQGKIPAGKSPQAADKKQLPSKQTHTPQATPQPPHDYPQQGKE